MDKPLLIRQLETALLAELPGASVQYRLAHLTRREALQKPVPENVRNAAVLILLFEQNAYWQIALIRRKSIDGDVHAGQIGLPGGRMQKGETPVLAALRETSEEIGCPPEAISVLGALTELHIPVSNHLVFPVVGYLPQVMPWTLQESEVEEILEVPLEVFSGRDAVRPATIPLRDGLIIRDVPSYRIDNHIVWGATAMILSEFVEVLNRLS